METKNLIDTFNNYRYNFNNIRKEFEKKTKRIEYSLGGWLYYDIYNDPEMLIYKRETDIEPRLIKKKKNKWEKGLIVYYFDTKDNIIEIKVDFGFLKNLYVYYFNKFYDNTIERMQFDPGGMLMDVTYYLFDDTNKLNKKYLVTLDGCKEFYFEEYNYFYNNRTIEKIIIRQYNEQNEEGVSELLFEYDKNNKLFIRRNIRSNLPINKGLKL